MARAVERRVPTQYVIDRDETSMLVWISTNNKTGTRGRVLLTRHALTDDEEQLVLVEAHHDGERRSEECLVACLRDMLALAEKRLELLQNPEVCSNK